MRAALLLATLVLAGCAEGPFGPGADGTRATPSRAIVVASSALGAEAGAEVLRQGGNAIDAAAAVALALTVVEPGLSGIGGGGFLLYRAADGRATALDGRETAPAASTADQFLLPGALAPQPSERAHTRGYAVGVPGAVALWDEALARWGTMGWREVAAPALRYAEEGFSVEAVLARELADPVVQQKLKLWPASAEAFFHDARCPPPTPLEAEIGCIATRPYAEGETLVRPDLARTLRLLQEGGRSAFYEGEVADAIVATQAAREGRMTLADLAAYEVVEHEPLRMLHRGDEILAMPPPGGGVILLHMMGLLEPMGLAADGHNSGAALHKIVEAQHLAYADRAAYLADPAFVDVPVAGMLHPDYLAARRALIGERANPHVEPGDPAAYEGREDARREARAGDLRADSHTSHIVVVDHDGNVASATVTVEAVFGNGQVVPGYGFVLNNELTDFDGVPGGANEVAPGKRPRSAMSPTIVLREGEPHLVVGAAGGPTIIMSVLQLLQNTLEHGMDAQAAIAAGRVHSAAHAAPQPDVTWDRDVGEDARRELRERGHMPSPAAGSIGRAALALRVDGAWTGAAEVRGGPGGVVVVDPRP